MFIMGRVTLVLLGLVAVSSAHQYLTMESDEIDSTEAGQARGPRSTSCPCGWTNKARIVGGRETHVNEFPFMVGITQRNSRFIFCGGTIISERHVLTAAHCTTPMKGKPLSVTIGEHDTRSSFETNATQYIDVMYNIDHPNYDKPAGSTQNDISLLVLERNIKFSQLVGPACLPTGRTNLDHQYIKVIGWGNLWTDGKQATKLMKVNLRVIPLDVCIQRYRGVPIPRYNSHQICTFSKGKDSCQGDSGGPLVWLDPQTNRYTLVALVSYGMACASDDPAVSTDVGYFLPWIRANLRSGTTCSKI